MTLPHNKARCAGRMDFDPDGQWCEQRDTCSRYLAFTQWDREAGIPSYRGIPVMMGAANCGNKIESEGD
ncbi:hypothetical protein [Stutzerimonas stutzeri]|uniref:hypothetical protein n=1 Tax=Stutzerimonas stutzeri TaxID=316 RepID=UPI00244D6DA8|nr:hypothetical protein [Stutzerimonas stutzeri]MDH0156522.1 hypothetical protein [Stutzerimonas stutzeri]